MSSLLEVILWGSYSSFRNRKHAGFAAGLLLLYSPLQLSLCSILPASLSCDGIWMYHPREAAFATRMGCSYHLMPVVHGHHLLLLPFWGVSWYYHSSASVSTDALERNQLKLIHNDFFNSSQFYLYSTKTVTSRCYFLFIWFPIYLHIIYKRINKNILSTFILKNTGFRFCFFLCTNYKETRINFEKPLL